MKLCDVPQAPPPLQGTVTLTKCRPEGPVGPDTVYCELERAVFRDVTYFSRGASCYAYQAVDPSGNRRIIAEFCPVMFSSVLFRTPGQVLQLGEKDWYEDYQKERIRFIRKWQTQSAVQDRNRLYGNNGPELYFQGQTPCLVMNYEGDLIRDFSGVGTQKLLQALLLAAEAIGKEHEAGWLLNDIKPDNLLFTGGGDTVVFRRLLDYGSAFPLEQMRREMIRPEEITSSAPFCSPELFNREYGELSFASDVYSFGQTVLSLLCGMTVQRIPETVDAFIRRIERRAPADAPVRRLAAKDPAAFYRHLFIFVRHTISEMVMPPEYKFDWQTEPYESGFLGALRLRSMKDVQHLLERVLWAARPEEILDLDLAWSVARRQAEAFENAGFGNNDRDQWELDRQLFSADMLAKYRMPDSEELLGLAALPELEGSFFLEGCSGSGKSVGMRWLYSCLAGKTQVGDEPAWLPVHLRMERAAASGLSLTAWMARELFGPREDRALAEETAGRWLNGPSGPRLLLLCDGVNEIPRDGSGLFLLDGLRELARTGSGRVRLIVSGQNMLQEFPGFPGRVLRIRPPEWETIRHYLYSRLPIAGDDGTAAGRIENLRQVLVTPQQVHDLCVPHIRKSRLHPRAIPDNASRLLRDYLHSWCAKEKIHRAVCGVNAYSSGQESGEPYGELLLAQLARLCWGMAQTGDYYISQSVLREQLRMLLLADGGEFPALGCSYLTEAESEQILSLIWSGVLFELDGQEMHIRHESYRDYLAAEYLADIFNEYTEKGFPPVLMQPIPEGVLGYLLPMLRGDTIQRLCGRIRTEMKRQFWGGIGRYFLEIFLDKRIRRKDMSTLHRDDLVRAGNTMFRLVRARGFSLGTRWRLLRGLPYDPRLIFRKEERP